MISELKGELKTVEEAIGVLQRMVVGRTKRRGRPPKWMSAMDGAPARKRAVKSRSTRTRAQKAR